MKSIERFATAASLTGLFAFAMPAQAHICMDAPVSRVGPNCSAASAQKPGPCGVNKRSTNVTEFKPGQTITVMINETVNHSSHYRIAFNPNGDTFENPTTLEDNKGNHPGVLLDNIMDVSAAKQSVQVTLPNVTCDNCTLQLIQVMYEGASGGVSPNDIYYSCADIVLKGEPVANPDGGTAADAGALADAGAVQDAGTPRDAGTTVSDASAAKDASVSAPDAGGSVSTSQDSGAPVVVADAGATVDAGHGEPIDPGGAPDESDDGCSVRAGREAHSRAWVGSLLGALALFVYRRRLPR